MKSIFNKLALTLTGVLLFTTMGYAVAASSETRSMNKPSIHKYGVNDTSLKERKIPDYTSLPTRISSTGERTFIFSPKLYRWAAYDKYGHQVAMGPGDGGADFCQENNEPCRTPSGSFRITFKRGVECTSSQFPVGIGGSPMPYCMFFKNGNAIHGSPYLAGANTSHGCIRILTGAAKWLSKHFLSRGTRVIVLPY